MGNTKDSIVIKAERNGDEIKINASIEGFTPNEFREFMFNMITNFTVDFNSEEGISTTRDG